MNKKKKYILKDDCGLEYNDEGFQNIENGQYYFNKCDANNFKDIKSMWRYFDLIPIEDEKNIVTFQEGKSRLIRIFELEKKLNNCQFYCKCENSNPTGTFKDCEASYVISKAKEMGINKLVFHSTGNTGRAYNLYANKANIETFFFLPLSCMDKNDHIMKSANNHIIAIDGGFKDVSKIAKQFANKNSIVTIAPTHDKLEGKATIAYEQFEELPQATIFAQTIAGGYGIMGFLLGHERLKEVGISPIEYKIPRIFAIQSEDVSTIAKAINNGVDKLTENDLVTPIIPFEKTLQSTNPLKTFKQVKECLLKTNGSIEKITEEEVLSVKEELEKVFKRNDIKLSYINEKSPYISYAGLLKMAKNGLIDSSDIIYMVITGSGRVNNEDVTPDAILKPTGEGYEILKATDYLINML